MVCFGFSSDDCCCKKEVTLIQQLQGAEPRPKDLEQSRPNAISEYGNPVGPHHEDPCDPRHDAKRTRLSKLSCLSRNNIVAIWPLMTSPRVPFRYVCEKAIVGERSWILSLELHSCCLFAFRWMLRMLFEKAIQPNALHQLQLIYLRRSIESPLPRNL